MQLRLSQRMSHKGPPLSHKIPDGDPPHSRGYPVKNSLVLRGCPIEDPTHFRRYPWITPSSDIYPTWEPLHLRGNFSKDPIFIRELWYSENETNITTIGRVWFHVGIHNSCNRNCHRRAPWKRQRYKEKTAKQRYNPEEHNKVSAKNKNSSAWRDPHRLIRYQPARRCVSVL